MSLRTLSRLLCKSWYREIFVPISLIDNRQTENAWSWLKTLARFLLFVRAIQFYLGKNNSFSNSFKHVYLDVKKTNKQNITCPINLTFDLYFLQCCYLDWFVHFQCQLSGTYSALSPPLNGATAGQQRILQHDCVSKVNVNL